MTIDVLPDLALLTIFDFYLDGEDSEEIETWQTLVHVCRKWRNTVFGSPRHLKLRLCCTAESLRGHKLDVWPLLPIVLRSDGGGSLHNIIAALEHNDRICGIDLNRLWISSSIMEKVLEAMQQPFPALTTLELGGREAAPVVSSSFLGGSAPSLESLLLCNIPFPGLPKLLLSATRLVNLQLLNISHSGYISPETMVTTLSVLTKLENFQISFDSPRSHRHPKSRRQFLQTRTLLPVLTGLWFEGAYQYIEDLVAQIDVPLLDELHISFLTFVVPPLIPFISRIPKSKPYNEAHVFFSESDVMIGFLRKFDEAMKLEFSCEESEDPEQYLSWVAGLCSSSLPRSLISVVEHLYIKTREEWRLDWELLDDETENDQWLELLRPFTSVKCLYITGGFEHLIARAMEELIGERVTEVLPALQTVCLHSDVYDEERFEKAFGPFVATRQLSGHPIAVSLWDGT